MAPRLTSSKVRLSREQGILLYSLRPPATLINLQDANKSGHKDDAADAPISPLEEVQQQCAALKQEKAALEEGKTLLQMERVSGLVPDFRERCLLRH